MSRSAIAVAIVLGLSVCAQAAVTAGYSSWPASTLPDHTIHIVWAESDTTAFVGFDVDVVDVDGELVLAPYDPHNPIVQIYPPWWPQGEYTGILFDYTQVITVPTGAPTPSHFSATFVFPGGATDWQTGTHLDIVQVVIPDGSDALVQLNCLVGGQEYLVEVTVPEPASAALLAIGSLALMRRRRFGA